MTELSGISMAIGDVSETLPGVAAALETMTRGCRLDPFARIGEAGVCAHGADQASGGDVDFIGAFDNVFEGEAHVSAALGEKAGGMGMAVERAPIRELKFLGYKYGTDPVEECFLDGVALGVFADGAFAAVTFEGGRVSGGIYG